MITYKDRSYCSTDNNKCLSTTCDRHLDTKVDHFKLVYNIHKLPISISDFSTDCLHYKKQEKD